jgi:hypothetical protein
MAIRAKMQLESVIPQIYGGCKAIYRCTYDPDKSPEDVSFAKATPAGVIEMQVDNPEAIAQMVIGQQYYVDFSPVPDPVK